MLKNYLFIFFISISGFSQSVGVYDDSWLLSYIYVDGNTYYNNTSGHGYTVSLDFNTDSSSYLETSVCKSLIAQYDLNELNRTFIITQVAITLEACNNSEVQDFENLYFDFFKASSIYNYELIPNLNFYTLTVTAPNGDIAEYIGETLSSRKHSNLSFSICPNPVKDKLFISSANNLSTYHVEIFDVLVKLKISEQLKSNSIFVEHLPKGVYFLVVKDSSGNSTTKKFVK